MLSTANLHTGLIVTAEKVIVGPASASHASTVADKTALIADDPGAIAAAHAFLDRLEDTVVDEVFLDSATAIWQIGRVVPLAGIGPGLSHPLGPRGQPRSRPPHPSPARRRRDPDQQRRHPAGPTGRRRNRPPPHPPH
ncbi:phosphatidylserine/phosphatidylglycerophosphate/cardiolipin synthase family protein, partial [Rhodococcus pyridinivorans]|nr:phosphatidylserine/phosphatidylglycerophosphate/cardiolipin synthase family protein [Rhodococcus pyridinivorans]